MIRAYIRTENCAQRGQVEAIVGEGQPDIDDDEVERMDKSDDFFILDAATEDGLIAIARDMRTLPGMRHFDYIVGTNVLRYLCADDAG